MQTMITPIIPPVPVESSLSKRKEEEVSSPHGEFRRELDKEMRKYKLPSTKK